MKSKLKFRKCQILIILGITLLLLYFGNQPLLGISSAIVNDQPDQSDVNLSGQRDFIILPDVENISVQNLLPVTYERTV